MKKYICIHGHFYQPPRENPWLEAVELQDSAAPYHDWNERGTAECYAPNSSARILDGEGRIDRILSNYSKISFNFGPTLLSWMQERMPEIHDAVVAADQQSRRNFSGHGSALAQVYNHIIMPLANQRDKQTQVIWGIRDFEHRFGRPPEGMWLSETAADLETLDTLAQHGIKFTILAPSQASRVREIGKRSWRDVSGSRVDPSRAYLVKLPAGRSLAVFFYDGPISQGIAFERLLENGEALANRLTGAFDDQRQRDQLVHIATDGESYGHHHKYGEMALAFALCNIESKQLAQLTNYGEFLAQHPPTHEAQIHDKSAWSCIHGVGRWNSDCGCNSGGHPGWNQAWRAPLRGALDWLRDEIAPLYETKAREFLRDPWKARDAYIAVILDRKPESRAKFFSEQAARELNDGEKTIVLKLLELQRHALLMYTSCGWFFDEISGIETVQVIQYAARVIQLAREVLGRDCEPGFLERLEQAKSNLPEHGDGRRIYEKFVRPAMVDFAKTAAHYAISSLFDSPLKNGRLLAYAFEDQDRQLVTSDKTRLLLGRVKITSEITRESQVFSYAILHVGEHDLTGGVRQFPSNQEYQTMFREIKAAVETADFPEAIRLMDRHFNKARYRLDSLFRDEQRRILDEILVSTREDLEGRFRLIAERYAPLMAFLRTAGAPLPAGLSLAAELLLHADIRRQLSSEHLDFDRLSPLIKDAQAYGTRVLDADISYAVTNRMEQILSNLQANPDGLERMRELEQLATLVLPLPLGLNLWKVQNLFWEMSQTTARKFRNQAAAGDGSARAWMEQFLSLGHRLGFALKDLEAAEVPLKAAA
jgi:alpha-amylase/alpha-mannosidase (GH57 family)